MIVNVDLNWEKLMEYEHSTGSSGSLSTASLMTDIAELDLPPQGPERDMYLMDLMSPGLHTPPAVSPRPSMRFHETLVKVHHDEESTNGSTETLVKELPIDTVETLSKKLSDMRDKHWHEHPERREADGNVSASQGCELFEGVTREIADGVLAV